MKKFHTITLVSTLSMMASLPARAADDHDNLLAIKQSHNPGLKLTKSKVLQFKSFKESVAT